MFPSPGGYLRSVTASDRVAPGEFRTGASIKTTAAGSGGCWSMPAMMPPHRPKDRVRIDDVRLLGSVTHLIGDVAAETQPDEPLDELVEAE
jgi:hypothetical protein